MGCSSSNFYFPNNQEVYDDGATIENQGINETSDKLISAASDESDSPCRRSSNMEQEIVHRSDEHITHDTQSVNLAHELARQHHIDQILKKRGKKLFTLDHARTAILHGAVLSGRILFVKDMLSNVGNCINSKDQLGNTALHLAAAHGDAAMIRYLLSVGARVNIGNLSGWSALHYAILGGNIDITEALLLHGAWAMYRDNTDATPLHVLCTRAGEFSILEQLINLLIAHSSSDCIEIVDKLGQTALNVAANCGNLSAAKILLCKGASPVYPGGLLGLADNMVRRRIPETVQHDMISLLTSYL